MTHPRSCLRHLPVLNAMSSARVEYFFNLFQWQHTELPPALQANELDTYLELNPLQPSYDVYGSYGIDAVEGIEMDRLFAATKSISETSYAHRIRVALLVFGLGAARGSSLKHHLLF